MKKLLKKNLRIAARKARKAKRVVLLMKRKTLRKSKSFVKHTLKQVKKTDFKIASINLSKVGAMVMVFGMLLQAAGMSRANTGSFFSDREISESNSAVAAGLDFALEDTGWSAYAHLGGLLPGDSIERSVKVNKLSGLDFQYIVTASQVAGSAPYCAALKIQALKDSVEVYNGSLLGLNIVPSAVIAADGSDDWKFVVSLPGDASEFSGLACEFNLEFYGWQQNLAAGGFNDTETLGNVVEGISSGPEMDDFVQGISPIGDAYVDEHADNNNFGTQHDLFVRSKADNQGNPENRRAFVQFNLPIPSIASVTAASLKLRLTNAPGEDRTLEARRVVDTWTESGIKWNNQPTTTPIVPGTVNTGTMNDVWKSWDVTSDVQSFAMGAYSNNGWMLKDASEGSTSTQESAFASREHSAEIYGPILEISLKAHPATTTHLVVNEVYYNVAAAGFGNDAQNEWVELYNPTNSPIDVSGWKVCDNSSCDVLPTSTPIAGKSFAVITNKPSTWGYWPGMPSGAVKIELNSEIGNGLANTGDRVILKDSADAVVDQMSYGSDTGILNPAIPHSGNGRSVARIIKGYDNDVATDWVVNATPNPGTNPSENGEEVMRFTAEGMEIAKNTNELTPLIDNPTPQTDQPETVTEASPEPECACSSEAKEPAPEQPKVEEVITYGGSGSTGSVIEDPAVPAQEDTASTTPVVEESVAPENPVSEEVISPVLDPGPSVVPVETPPAEIEQPQPVIEPEPAAVPAPAEVTPAGGSNE